MKILAAALAFLIGFGLPAFGQTKFAPMRYMNLPQLRPWTGDFDGMLKRRSVRILVPYSKSQFFVSRGQQLGAVAELGGQLDQWLNAKYKTRAERINVWFIPVPRDDLLSALKDGRGDIAAGNLTITPERLAEVDFTGPWRSKVDEIVVTGPAAPPVRTIEDLAGREVFVHQSSAFAEHLRALNESFAAKGLKPITFRPADGNLEDEDILEMVNAGLLPLAVVDDYKAILWASVYRSLVPRPDLVVNSGGSIAWAIRKDSPRLKNELAAFVSQHRFGTAFGNDIRRRYSAVGQIVRNPYSDADTKRFHALVDIFKNQGKAYGFDWRMLIAQGYQESQLDQSLKAPGGAVGVMQILPSTAAAKPMSVTGVATEANRNVQAGAAYMRYLIDVYIGDEPSVNERNRMLFAFAAYNAGPANLTKFRRLAMAEGLNPNVWFDNVEHAAAQVVGIVTVRYVSNIYKYYIAYTLAAEREAAANTARGQGVDGSAPK